MSSTLRAGLRRTELVEVVRAASRGDQVAITELVNHCLPQVAKYVAHRGSADAEALANLVMAEFVRNLNRLEFDNPGQIWSYIYRMSRSRLLDERRKIHLEHSTEMIDVVDEQGTRFDEGVANQLWVRDLLSGLTKDQRQVVELRFKDDLTLEETARRVGKTLTAVKGLQRRALATLAAAAALIAIVWTMDQSPIRVQSSDPAESSETRLNFRRDQAVEELYEGARGQMVTEPSPDSSQNLRPSPPTTTREAGTLDAGAPSIDLDDPLLAPQNPTTTIPPPPVPSPHDAVDDVAVFVHHQTSRTWIDIDVAANDGGILDRLTLRLLSQPSTGFVDVVPLGAQPILRFFAAGPNALQVFDYELCGPDSCSSATVTVDVIWYASDGCAGLTPTIVGTPGDDVLVGTAGPDIIFGYGGDDDITGGAGDDIICGGDGADIIDGNDGNDVLYGGRGGDDIVGNEGNDVIYGQQGADFLDGNRGVDSIYGGNGGDDITGGGGMDYLFGEGGDDSLIGGNHADFVFGGLDDDFIEGLSGSDLLYGGSGNDKIHAGTGIDRVLGGIGDDSLTANGAEDILDGAGGTDFCISGILTTSCEAMN